MSVLRHKNRRFSPENFNYGFYFPAFRGRINEIPAEFFPLGIEKIKERPLCAEYAVLPVGW